MMGVSEKIEMVFVCCYFNPCNYLSKYINFLIFYQEFRKNSNVDLLVVESYNNNSKYRIRTNVDNLISVKSESTLWEKEALLNIGINKTKTKYKYVGWVDADVFFVSKNWEQEILSQLKDNNIVQICKIIHQQKSHENLDSDKTYSMCHYARKSDDTESIYLSRLGEPGYGCVYNSSIFKNTKTPLYDKAIMGSGDYLNLIGHLDFTNYEDFIKKDRLFRDTPMFLEDFNSWRKKAFKVKTIGVANCEIKVLFHGLKRLRKYITRETILRHHKYNPKKDIEKIKGIYRLKNKELAISIENYFISRKEDDNLLNLLNTSEFRKKLIPLILKVDPTFDSSRSPMEYLHKLKNLKPCEIKIKERLDKKSTTIGVTLYNKDFNIANASNNKIVINKVLDDDKYNHNTWYLNYIINHYENLPELCFFVNENISNILCEKINTIKDTLDNRSFCKYTSLNDEYTLIKLSNKSLHANETTAKETRPAICDYIKWYYVYASRLKLKPNMNKKFTTIQVNNKNIEYCNKNSFYVGGEIIRSHPKKTYEQLIKLNKLNGGRTENNIYTTFSWPILFR